MGTLVANEVKKIPNEFVWGQDGSLGATVSLVPLPGYVTAVWKVILWGHL